MKNSIGRIAVILGIAAALAGSSSGHGPIIHARTPVGKRHFKSKRTNQLHKMKRGGHTYIFG